jgi:type IX secretion system PorP/SprF family membrane protein
VPIRSLILVLVSLCCCSRAQDIHFSQYNGALLNISPGFTGLFDGDYRVGAIYRSQWQSVPVSYNTVSLYGESRLKPVQMEKDMLGVGFTFNNDRAGDARYGTTQFYANGSYICLANADTSVIVTGGLNIGWGQVGFDYSKMTFDSQYDGSNYNSSLPSGEQFHWQKRNFFDMNVGGALRYLHKERHLLTYGLGIYHVTRPKISYQGDELSRLDFKIANYLSYITPIGNSQKTDLVAECLFTMQGKNYELIPHASIRYLINDEKQQRILGGLCFRSRDAIVARFGYNQGTLQSGISYDINISHFTPATNRRGGFEIFVNYIIKVKPGFIAKKRLCPLFI